MAKKLWGGRFGKETDPLVEEFTRSIQYDYKLTPYDLLGSIAHVKILGKAGYLTDAEVSKLMKAMKSILASVLNGTFKVDRKAEDIHTNIQNILQEKVGDLVQKLHTARSRNDQVVVAMKMYCKDMLEETEKCLKDLESALLTLAGKNKDLVIPGFTHMQHAQPVYLKDYLTAYVNMLKRDAQRISFVAGNIRITMGSGALAGTPIDSSKYNLKDMGGFSIGPATNSIDTVSDRDFVIDILSALSVVGMHLSRLSEDLIIWSTKEFGFVDIDEAFCTGSSLMPQKKNADVLELARGYAARLAGNLVSVLGAMKGLPLTYNRDMQLDKEPLFNSFEIALSELKVFAGLIKTLKFNKDKIEEHLEDESLYATDMVYYLVKKGVAFKNAHTIVGRLVKYSIDNSIEIKSMTDKELKKFSDKFARKDILNLFNPKVSVGSKRSIKRR